MLPCGDGIHCKHLGADARVEGRGGEEGGMQVARGLGGSIVWLSLRAARRGGRDRVSTHLRGTSSRACANVAWW